MRHIILVIFFLLSDNASALGGYATLSGDDKVVTDAIKGRLQISESDAYKLYELVLKGFLNTKTWSVNHYDNESLVSARVGKSANKTAFVNFVTDNRYVNLTFIKFPLEKQILIHTVETLPRSSQAAVDKYNSQKSEASWTIGVDSPEFSTFNKKGNTDKIKILVTSGAGGIQFVDIQSFDLEK
jgi:hypothetical protein